MSADLTGRVAVVTGAGSGIGRGAAVALASAGADLVLNDLDPRGLVATEELIAQAGGRVQSLAGDVSHESDVVDLIGLATSAFGGVDVLHANAGVERYQELAQMSDADMDLVLHVDLKGALLCAKRAIPAMRARGGGSIIFTASVQATHSLPGCVLYAAAKAGLVAAARTLALEVGPFRIRVNAISPGTIDTPMLSRDLADMDVAESQNFLRNVEEANALRRIGTVAEIGAAVLFLASDASSYVTGTNLVVDGGFTAVKKF